MDAFDNLTKYKIFLSIADNKSISKASVQLYMPYPAVGITIRKPEESLNTTLFIRKSKGVEPGYYQSGTMEFQGKMVKRGSSQLRCTLMNCTLPLIRFSPVLLHIIIRNNRRENLIVLPFLMWQRN